MNPHPQRVLLLSKVRAGGHLYYLAGTPGPDGAGVEPPGYWVGRGSEQLGLAGIVAPAALKSALDGRHPLGGAPLGADRRRVSVTAFDLTFCAPKSVSLLQALGPSEVTDAVRRSQERAVEAALGYIEDHALAVRRAVPGVGDRPVPVAVESTPAAAYLHHTSRELDPHLHTHVVVANVGRGPDEKFSALDGRGIYAHGATAGALYHAQLRHELTTSLGVAWGPLDHGRADVAGIGEAARLEFSRRSAAIAAHLAGRGLLSDAAVSRRAAYVAGLATRPPKDLDLTTDDLLPWWRERARSVGLGPARLEAVLDRVPRRELAERQEAGSREFDGAVAAALGASGSVERSFARRHLVRAWAGSRPLGEPARLVEERVDRFLESAGLSDAHTPDRPRLRELGVAERRHRLGQRLLAPDRSTSLERSARRGRDVGRDDVGIDLSL